MTTNIKKKIFTIIKELHIILINFVIMGNRLMSEKSENFKNELITLLRNDVFKKLVNIDSIKIGEVKTIVALLIKANIDFDLSFSAGSQR